MLTGGCYCRAIRYEIHSSPLDATLCHCATCRKVSAAPAVAWFSVSKSGLLWVRGTPKTFESSPGVLRAFCSNCGTPLTYANAGLSDVVDVSTCSLDEPGETRPASHIWCKYRLTWDGPVDGLPEYPEAG
ncbi:GFA family protein [Paraburkholderia megapolitana]|uniref:GFA family protein n=1 Tax=Paraburkholderia megapolitana TaxID=420953 RepID=UPI003FD8E4B4